MRKIIYICDRCNTEIKGPAKFIAINDLDEDGLIVDGDNPLDECQFCSKCAADIFAYIANPAPKKRRGRPPHKDIYSRNAKAMLAKDGD